jgi:hypothetical protein
VFHLERICGIALRAGAQMEGHTMKLKDVDEVLKAARAGDESCGRCSRN